MFGQIQVWNVPSLARSKLGKFQVWSDPSTCSQCWEGPNLGPPKLGTPKVGNVPNVEKF